VRRQLDPESHLSFGEGGAGTWSDGKLTTRIGRNSDPVRRVLATLVQLGAPDSILVSGKPHLGGWAGGSWQPRHGLGRGGCPPSLLVLGARSP
jgi:uncharacterized FAD-dependent dehydrogenase